MALSPGARLGPYEIVAPLGAGGMGEVYQARGTRLGRTVALKTLAPHISADPHLRARFEREGRAIAALDHPHICALHDIGRHETMPGEETRPTGEEKVVESIGSIAMSSRMGGIAAIRCS